jgi:nucleotide-binding universal stress UspA family protein
MFQKILLPTDGSENAEKTIQYAIQLAQLSQATIVVMYAYNPQLALRKRAAVAAEAFRASLQEEAMEIVTEVAEHIKAAGLAVSALAVEGSPAEAILHASEDVQPDLIIMGSRGGGGLPGLALGSTAERVVRHSTVPVLVVK